MRCSPSAHRLSVVLIGALLLAGRPVSAQPSDSERATARALFERGCELMADGRLNEACPKLVESLRLVPGTGTRFKLAECYEKSGKLASAWVNFLEVATDARNAGRSDQEKVARDRALALKPRLATLKIEVADRSSAVTVQRDGELVPPAQWDAAIPVDLGEHTVTARTAAGANCERTVRIDREGQAESVRIERCGEATKTAPVAPPPTAAPSAEPPVPFDGDERGSSETVTAGWVVTILGGVAATTGGILLGVGLGKVASAEEGCPTRIACSAESTDEGNQGRTIRDAGGVLLGVGGAALISGIVALAVGYAADSDPASPVAIAWVNPVVAPGQVAIGLGSSF